MSTHIYALEIGDYSDARVLGYYSTQELADKARTFLTEAKKVDMRDSGIYDGEEDIERTIKRSYWPEIVVHQLDVMFSESGKLRNRYQVTVNELEEQATNSLTELVDISDMYQIEPITIQVYEGNQNYYPPRLVMNIWADTEKEANDLAIRVRDFLLETKRWKPFWYRFKEGARTVSTASSSFTGDNRTCNDWLNRQRQELYGSMTHPTITLDLKELDAPST